MEVILLERVEKLGQMGDVVRVRSGYARNYLLPHRKALRATNENRATFDSQRQQLEADNLKQREEAQQIAKKMKGLMVVVVRQASDSDQLYGSVTTKDLASTISSEGFSIRRQQIRLDRPIKTVGIHQVRIDLHPEVYVHVTTNVARSAEEAKLQEKGEQVSKGDNDLISQNTPTNIMEIFEEEAQNEVEGLAEATIGSTPVEQNEIPISAPEGLKD
tara:strand:- start:790 stop:1440 length:651 start_codon:yes stop_codon:yes gene_type:complete